MSLVQGTGKPAEGVPEFSLAGRQLSSEMFLSGGSYQNSAPAVVIARRQIQGGGR